MQTKEAKVFVRFIPIGSEVEKRVNTIADTMKRLSDITRPNPESLKAFKESSALAVQISREEKAAAQAKSAKLNVSAKEVILERQLLALKEAQAKADRKNNSEDKTSSYRAASYKTAVSDIQRMQKENARWEKQISAEIMRGDKLTADNKAREAKRGANEVINSLKQVSSQSAKSAGETRSIFSQAFSGSFFGSLAGNISTYFLGQISQLPGRVGQILDEMVQISSDRANALKGLESIAVFKGIDSSAAQDAVKNLRLVKAGVLEVGDATSGLKSLLQSGFSLEQAVQVMERFSDAAAFGKQSALSYGEAISRAAEGIKNQNSELVDNVGLTKNLSVILKERGFELEDLTDKTKQQSAINALYNGILAETTAQVGDADKITQGYTGSVAALNTAQKNLYATFGDLITQSPEMREANKVLTEQINQYTEGVKDADSETGKFTRKAIKEYAALKGSIFSLGASIVETFKMSGMAVVTGVSGVMTALVAIVESAIAPIRSVFYMIHRGFIEANNLVADLGIPTGSVFGSTKIEVPAEPDYLKYTKKAAEMTADYAKSVKESYDKIQALGKEFDAARERIRSAPNNISISPQFYDDKGNKIRSAKTSNESTTSADTGSGLRGKKRKALNEDERTSRDIAEIAKALGFNVGSLQRGNLNAGSLHSSGKALDISIRGKTDQEVAELIAALLKKGFRVVDERKKIPGVNQTGPHIHAEANDRKESYLAWDKSLKYGNIPVEMLKKLDSERFSKSRGGIEKTDISNFIEKQSDEKTKAEREKNLRSALELYKILGLIPDGPMLDRFRELMVEDAKKTGEIQPTENQVKQIFEDIRASRPMQEVVKDDLKIGTSIVTEEEAAALREYDSLLQQLNDTIWELTERTQEERLSKQLLREEYVLLKPEQKEYLLSKAREIDASKKAREAEEEGKRAMEEAQEKYRDAFNQTADRVENVLSNIAEKNWSGLFDSIFGELRRFLIRAAAEWVTSKFFKLISGQGANPNVQSSGSFLQNILGGLFNTGNGGGFGGATPPFFPSSSGYPNVMNYSGGNSSARAFGSSPEEIARQLFLRQYGENYPSNNSNGGGFFGNLGSLFSSGEGGLFAPKKNLLTGKDSKLGGMLGGIGSLAALAGSAVGGRFGGIISAAGTGMSIGSMFGPIGAVAGGIIGGIIGLFGGNKNKKKDKKENLPSLQKSFAEAFDQYRQLIVDVKALRVDPDGALSQGDQLRTQIKSGFGIQFLSKYGRKESEKQIKAKLDEIDRRPGGLREQLETAVEIAKAAGDRATKLIPEFADGYAYSGFSRRNGLLQGGIPNRDSLPSLLMPGEIVANQRQQERIRAMAGFDVFAYAGIPNYPKPKKMESGGYIGNSTSASVPNTNLTLELHNVTLAPDAKAYIRSDEGKREIAIAVKDAGKNGVITQNNFRKS